MNKKANLINKLEAINCPVITRDLGYGAEFCISGEDNHHYLWGDYYQYDYGVFGVSSKLDGILTAAGYMAEWINPGLMGVYKL